MISRLLSNCNVFNYGSYGGIFCFKETHVYSQAIFACPTLERYPPPFYLIRHELMVEECLIRLHPMSLTHPQTLINRSLPKAFKRTKPSGAQSTSKKIQKHLEVQKLCKNQASKPSTTSRTSTSNARNIQSRIIQTICLDLQVHWNQAQKPPETSTNHKSAKLYGLSLQSPEELPLQTFKNEEQPKRNHSNHLPRSHRSLESNSKASRNLNKLQISEVLQIQASKVLKNFNHKSSNTKNI